MIGYINKFYSCYVTIVVGIDNCHSLAIDMHHGNYPNESKLALYKVLIQFNNSLKVAVLK